MTEPLVTIFNHQGTPVDDAPIADGSDKNLYIGYFENPEGEQYLFVFDRETKRGQLRGGGIGWNEGPLLFPTDIADDFLLGEEECRWLNACLDVCRRM